MTQQTTHTTQETHATGTHAVTPAAHHKLSREDQAKIEIGHTTITPAMKWALVAVLFATVFVEPVTQTIYELWQYRNGNPLGRTTACPQPYDVVRRIPEVTHQMAAAYDARRGDWFQRVLAANNVLLNEIVTYENTLKDDSFLGKLVRPPTQSVLVSLGCGNEKAYIGRDGWLFYRPEVEYLIGPGFLDPKQLAKRAASGTETRAAPQPDPAKAILDFASQLRGRGIELVVVPLPSKLMVHPEEYSSRFVGCRNVLQNSSYAKFVARLREGGVTVFDPSDDLVAARLRGEPQYIRTDTHWTPQTMQRTAGRLGELLRGRLGGGGQANDFALAEQKVANLGDIAVMLQLPADQRLYSPQEVTIRQVSYKGQACRPSRTSRVLLLGDSYTNIYSLGGMGWGEGAGFAEHLSAALGDSLDCLARNDSGAYATREMLSRQLAAGEDRLAGKKIVVWEFATRELSEGDWRLLPMALGKAKPSTFLAIPPGKTIRVRAQVVTAAPAPRPGTVAYKDHIVGVRLTHLTGPDGPIDQDAYVMLWSMRDGVWVEGARLREGDWLTLTLRRYDDVAQKHDQYNRAELDDLALEQMCWGEIEK